MLFDEVFLPGVVEKELPRAGAAGSAAAGRRAETFKRHSRWRSSGTPLPLHAREREREPFAFHAALQCARQRAVLSYPRREAAASRERLPSAYLLRVLEAATGRPVDYAALETFIAADAHGRRVSVKPHARRARRNRRHGLSVRRGAAGRGAAHEFVRAAGVSAARPAVFRARGGGGNAPLSSEDAFTAFDGVVEDAALGGALSRVAARSTRRRCRRRNSNSTRLCPFHYFVSRILEAEPASEPPEIQRVAARERGALVHRILERFYQSETRRGPAAAATGGAGAAGARGARLFPRF